MKTIVDKLDIIRQKENGHSNRQVAKMLGINRKTVAKYWNQYMKAKAELENPDLDIRETQAKLVEEPKYNSKNRGRIKYTFEINQRLHEILKSETIKDKLLGPQAAVN